MGTDVHRKEDRKEAVSVDYPPSPNGLVFLCNVARCCASLAGLGTRRIRRDRVEFCLFPIFAQRVSDLGNVALPPGKDKPEWLCWLGWQGDRWEFRVKVKDTYMADPIIHGTQKRKSGARWGLMEESEIGIARSAQDTIFFPKLRASALKRDEKRISFFHRPANECSLDALTAPNTRPRT